MSTSGEIFGAPCWVSLATRDLASAEAFYGAALGWTFRPTRLGEEFRVALQGGVPVAGIGAVAPRLGIPMAWTPYFAVEDADVTAARIRERGATTAVGPLAFATGRAALAADREGAAFGYWEGEVVSQWTSAEDGAAWAELRSRDPFAAAVFYGEVLDWATGRPGSLDVAYEHDHVVVRRGTMTVARISGGAVGGDPDPRLRPRWCVHFAVPDLDEAAERAVRAGGSPASPVEQTPTDRRMVLRDKAGALFTITEVRDPGA
ncbi:VOC family protein [Streptomyces globosus]|uniref:VOC family protein n=1 Tax=Streptomyces globosus TaxID=68209 RepID=A0A344U0R3_9ACTN|nr:MULTISPECIES: VOC family protein [Streptomyces]AXE24484.1 VOC family protein [Streptomyces globosus]